MVYNLFFVVHLWFLSFEFKGYHFLVFFLKYIFLVDFIYAWSHHMEYSYIDKHKEEELPIWPYIKYCISI